MFRHLRIKNFKAWEDTREIRLAPITVFFGSNSAGKSSIIQFLLMLKQTAESPDRRRVLHPGDALTPVDLGTFRDIVYQHEMTRLITFDLGWRLPVPLVFRDSRTQSEYRADAVDFRAVVGADAKAQLHVDRMSYALYRGDDEELVVGMMPSKAGVPTTYKLTSHRYDLVRNLGRAWPPRAPVKFYGFPDEVFAYYQNAEFLSYLTFELETQLRRVHYLGPLRNRPERVYTWGGDVPEHVGWRGEAAISALLAGSDRHIMPGFKKRSRTLQQTVAHWLKEMGLLESFRTKPIAEQRKEHEVLVRTLGSPKEVNLTDVGFGISQVLPVLVSCFYAAPHSTILMEQPELHLHPGVQSKLGDLFIEAIRSRENNSDRNIQLIVESHSEHLLRRLQRRIAEGEISHEDVALYFCEMTEAGACLQPLEVDLLGRITNWPRDFFGDDMEDVVAMTEAAADRVAKR